MTEEEVREAILSAADQLFYERGFQSVPMDELRDKAGVPLKRIYACFPSKDDLVRAYLAHQDDRWRDGVESYVKKRSDDPVEQLLLVFDAVEARARHQARFRGCAFHNAFGELGGTCPDAVAVVRSHKHHLRDFLVRTARRAGLRRPAELGLQLLLLAEGALITAAIDDDPGVPRRARAAAAVLVDSARSDSPRQDAGAGTQGI
ncbi:MAG: TetR/AcrR family transcriptional regulator [Acidimicrobiales bacterium]